ncbi:MAG: lipase, partial [Mycobacteriaceae bacterium]|nr:lipase [Mycobacteriaceae bacterium]
MRLRLLSLLAVGALAAPVQAATTSAYAPLDRPGPALSVPAATLKAALHCVGDFRHGTLEPVLLSPGTSATPEQNFSWN